MLGLDNAGKTTILKAMTKEDITTTAPTQGFNIKSLQHDGIKLNVWDIGGQKAIREYWSNYFEASDALVYVVDSSDRVRFEESSTELKQLLENTQLANIPLLVFANKQDMATAAPLDEITGHLGLGDRGATSIMACAATKGDGLEEGMSWLVGVVAEAKGAA